MYLTLQEASRTLITRKTDKVLVETVRQYIGELPEIMEISQPLAIYCPYIATPNQSTILFKLMAESVGLKPVVAEYLNDVFVWQNADKKALIKLVFNNGVGRNGGSKSSQRLIVDPTSVQRVSFRQVSTASGVSLVDFHHNLLAKAMPGLQTTDFLTFYKKQGGMAKKYYRGLMAVFTCFGVMFENYLTTGSEGEFVQEVVRPAIKAVEEDLGVSPLITRLLPQETETSPYWTWYPSEVEKLM